MHLDCRFPALRVSEDLSKMFGVAVERPDGGCDTYRWSTLPMGWGPSPWIASSVGYAAILWRQPNEEKLFDLEEGLTQLPTFVPVIGRGFLCLYYDNILVVHTDYGILEKVKRRLDRNFSGKDHVGPRAKGPQARNHVGTSLNTAPQNIMDSIY